MPSMILAESRGRPSTMRAKRDAQSRQTDRKITECKWRTAMRRHFTVGAILLSILVALAFGSELVARRAAAVAADAPTAPRFEVDPLWPKPLPNHWLLGQTIGVSVDARDHIRIIHRPGSLEPGQQPGTTNPPTAV